MNYRTMTDDEVEQKVREITRTSYSEEQVRRRIREELEYPYTDSIALTSASSGEQIMFMLMMHGRERIISV